MFKAEQIGEYFVRRGIQTGNQIDLVQVIKITYIAHGFYLGTMNQPLINEDVEAWKYGPVIPEIYQYYKDWSKDPILKENPYIDPSPVEQVEGLDRFLDLIFNKYSLYTASQLIRLTHQKNTPWSSVYDPAKRNVVIPQKSIADHYKSLVSKNAA